MIQAVRRDSKSDNQLHLPKIPNLGNERIGSSLIPINEESTMYISSGQKSRRSVDATRNPQFQSIDSSPFTSPLHLQSKTTNNQTPSQWKNKFRLLEVRRELKFASASQLVTSSLLKNMSPQLSARDSLKEQIQLWGSEGSLFGSTKQKKQEKTATELRKEQERIDDALQESGLIKKIDQSFEGVIEDNQKHRLLGEQAPMEYFDHYKKVEKVSQQNKFFQIRDSTFTSLLSASQKLMVTPCKIGLIKEKGSDEDLTIKNMKFGDSYAKVLSEGIRSGSNVQNFYLGGNRITKDGADELIHAVSKKAKVLDLSENLIGNIGCQHIANALKDRDSKIEVLNLEGNKLGDIAVSLVLNALENNKVLAVLNLSKNFLSDKISEKLARIIESNYNLKELYLHWNQIKAQGGTAIFQALADNESIKVVDVSCNSFGSGNVDVCTDSICHFLVTNTIVCHLDLSNNYIKSENAAKIADSLVKNKTIYGFHFSGNAGYVDSRGFLVVKESSSDDLTGIHVKRRINGKLLDESHIN